MLTPSELCDLVHMKGSSFMVYVINKNGQPLMPTNRNGKVRHLIRDGKAKIIKRCPFTIQLLYEGTNYTQDISLGIDPGSKHIGVSATTESNVLYEADVELRNDIVGLLSARRLNRRDRRGRKTRYRKARFDNRVSVKRKGWSPPSIKHKIQTHLTVVQRIYELLPITKIIIEIANFDIQKIESPDISGTEYQHGVQLGFWNTREYVLCRDNYTCQCCNGRSKDNVLNVHHIESRSIGGDAPNNLITLCKTCHMGYHKGTIKLPKSIKRGTSRRDMAFMNITRWALYDSLRSKYPNVDLTYGYITKNVRINNNLPKAHYIDARCISGHPNAKSNGEVFFQKKVRCHNRRIHKNTILKGGIRKRNQAPYKVMGFRLFDKVKWKGVVCFIFGRRLTGRMDLRLLDGTKINASVLYKNLRLLEPRSGYLTERRVVQS